MTTKAAVRNNTHFEQVPLDFVKQIAGRRMDRSPAHLPLCAICASPVDLERCKTDEYGNAVHDACYIARMARPRTPQR